MGRIHEDLKNIFPLQNGFGTDLGVIELKKIDKNNRIQIQSKDQVAKYLLCYKFDLSEILLIDNQDIPIVKKRKNSKEPNGKRDISIEYLRLMKREKFDNFSDAIFYCLNMFPENKYLLKAIEEASNYKMYEE